MDALTAEALAVGAGTSESTVARLVSLGILEEEAGGFRPGDITRVRLALALEASGVPLDAVGDAIRAGRLSLGFLDSLTPSPVALLKQSHRQRLDELGLDEELRHGVRSILGTLGASDDDPVRQDDANLYGLMAKAHELGVGNDQLVRIVRSIYDSVYRLAAAQRDFVDENLTGPALRAGMSEQQMLDTTSAPRRRYRELGRLAAEILLERAVEEWVFQDLVQHVEGALAEQGIARRPDPSPPAVAFVDVSGFTRLTDQSGDEAAARHAAELAGLAHSLAVARGGRLVKLLGDGAMLVFHDATSAVHSTLDLVEQGSDRGLPPLHAGISAGPLVRRDGDYFGTVVNVAARTGEFARPREVLVTAETVEAWAGGEDVRFQVIGPIALKGLQQPVVLYQAFRA